jgi:lipid II:glycine glycyltransferase (peptidoglycan interpeptide bridge formation enzyme)
MTNTILTTADKEQWKRYLQDVGCQDIFFQYEYMLLNEQESGYNAEMFIYESDDNLVIYPYLKIPLRTFPFFRFTGCHEDFFDITSLEYGGAVMKNPEPNVFTDFLHEFNQYCRNNNIITEFVRLHPSVHENYQTGKEKIKETLYIDLTQDTGTIMANYRKSNRNAISRAQRERIHITRSKNTNHLDQFYTMYITTMKRRRARSFYLYTREYFDRIVESLDNNIELFMAYHHGQAVAGAIFLHRGDMVYYYLAGSKPEFGKYGASNYLMHQAILWAKENGFTTFHLGSGYQPEDSLFWFKSSFTRQSTPYWRYRKIHLPSLYIQFIEAKEKYNQMTNSLADKNFFPIYRG